MTSLYRNGTAEKLVSDFLLRLNFTVKIKHVRHEDSDYGTRSMDALYDISLGISEIATPIILLKDITNIGYITHEVDWAELVWYTPCAKPKDRIQKIATIFSTTLWIALVVALIATGITM
jgi:hypothetical protein